MLYFRKFRIDFCWRQYIQHHVFYIIKSIEYFPAYFLHLISSRSSSLFYHRCWAFIHSQSAATQKNLKQSNEKLWATRPSHISTWSTWTVICLQCVWHAPETNGKARRYRTLIRNAMDYCRCGARRFRSLHSPAVQLGTIPTCKNALVTAIYLTHRPFMI